MKVIINKNKPFYHDETNNKIRMGNFKETAKELEYEDESVLSIFNNAKDPIEYNELIRKVSEETKVKEDEIDQALTYLLSEAFIIDYSKYDKVIKKEDTSRMNLYLSMFKNEYKNYEEVFKNKKILVLGLGGIGSNVINILVRSGFKNFIIVDNDIVEKSNLQKQFFFNQEDIGRLKTKVISEKISAFNKDINIKEVNLLVKTEEDIEEYINESDIVISTVDKPARKIRRIVNRACLNIKKPVIFAGFSEHYGMIGPFVVPGKTACLVCNETETLYDLIENRDIIPSYGPLCLTISSIIADEIINFFTNYKYKDDTLQGKTLMFDFYNYSTNKIKWNKNINCKECAK